ncbi:g6851 [Coccomyxa elongata]
MISYHDVHKAMHAASCGAERSMAHRQSVEAKRVQQENVAKAAAQEAELQKEVQREKAHEQESAARAAEAAALAKLSRQRQVQAVREQSEELRALQFAVNEAKAAMQREQQERDNQLLQAEEKGYSLALDSLVEAERKQAMDAVKDEERCRKSREARALQDLQQQMAQKITAQAEMQVRLALLHLSR